MIVTFRGGSDEHIRNESIAMTMRVLWFHFSILYNYGLSQMGREMLGTIDINQALRFAVRRLGVPPSVKIKIRQSHPCRAGVDSRTVSIAFYTCADSGDSAPSGTELWSMVPFDIGGLTRTVEESVAKTILNNTHWRAA
tara:strand:- start:121 stop:537 length:417 start_codon:yes stop_codon:yes gene_type:complete